MVFQCMVWAHNLDSKSTVALWKRLKNFKLDSLVFIFAVSFESSFLAVRIFHFAHASFSPRCVSLTCDRKCMPCTKYFTVGNNKIGEYCNSPKNVFAHGKIAADCFEICAAWTNFFLSDLEVIFWNCNIHTQLAEVKGWINWRHIIAECIGIFVYTWMHTWKSHYWFIGWQCENDFIGCCSCCFFFFIFNFVQNIITGK